MSSHGHLHAGSIEMIREALEHLDQGFSIFDGDFRLTAFNRNFLELLDFPEEMGQLGRPLADFFRYNATRGDYGSEPVDDLVEARMALAAKAEPHHFERVRPNGTVIEVRGQPLPCGGFVTTYTDITDRKRWEDDLEAAKSAAELGNRAKSDFLNMVSHELRTPLTAIRCFSEILCDNPHVELDQRMDFLRVIDRECRRLIRMINDLLDFSKIEAGRIDWQITALDPKSLVESAVASVTPMFEEKRIDLTLMLPPQAPSIMGDADRLSQVVVNLLSNAHKFSPEDTGRVHVGMDVGTTELTLSVADNGPGIPPDEHDEIFKEFHQGVTEDGSHPPGTGLGLAICRKIVDHLGGRIWVESEPGRGATFRFTMPVCH